MAWATRIGSGSWRGLYRDGAGKTRTVEGGPFRHKSEAVRRAGEAEIASRRRALTGQREPGDLPTWAEWSETWISQRVVEPSTARTDEGRVKKYLMPQWGNVQLHKITKGEVRAWVKTLREPGKDDPVLADATIMRLVHLLSASMESAVEGELIPFNPAHGLKFNFASNPQETYLTEDQFWSVLDAIDEDYKNATNFLVTTGTRLGEAIGLHKPRILESPGLIEIRDVWDTRNRIMKAYPKGKSRRFVPMPDWVRDENTTSKRGETCGYPHKDGKCIGGLFLQSPEGYVLDGSQLRKAFKKACLSAGLPELRLHDLRHTYASWLIQGGVSLAEVGRLLGHKSPQTTDRYAHLADVPKDQILAALPTRNTPVPATTKLRLVK